MKTPPITKKQKEIIFLLYKFRFLHTRHIQNFLGHINPNRTLAWLKDLIEKGYVRRHYERKSFQDNTKPAMYYLGPASRHILKKEKALELEDLEYIYQEHRRGEKFINHSLFLANVYLYLVSQKSHNEELMFFTKTELKRYKYFPDPMSDAFIAIKGEESTRRYFLDFFDDFTPSFALRQRVRTYLEYAEKSDWDENTDSTPLPSILFICPNESAKKHVSLYAKSLLEKSYDDKIALFLTTKKRIERGEKDNIWEKVDNFAE